MKKIIFILCCFVLSCSDEQATHETLEKQGFTDIEPTGWAPFSCSDNDSFSTGFNATNPQGKRVSGVVCCGIMKNCTVRW